MDSGGDYSAYHVYQFPEDMLGITVSTDIGLGSNDSCVVDGIKGMLLRVAGWAFERGREEALNAGQA
jgi:hypothetical protein